MAVEPPYGSCLKRTVRVGFKIGLGSVLVSWFQGQSQGQGRGRSTRDASGMQRGADGANGADGFGSLLLVEVELGLFTFFVGRRLP